ncbi:hypothetical protein JCM8115_000412 [Rhodotorula mucilaginosa]|jgi:hypothetical protein|nr:hypothetical protein B0A53_01922 [Rhodotorula sp. CCFEE 5036]
MRADVASLRAEVAQLREAQTRTVAPPDPPATTAVPLLPLAAGVAPPSLANRLPIPSMPIGANHFRQAPVTPTRPRPISDATATYPTPTSVHRNNLPAAALPGYSDPPTSATGGGVPVAVPVAVSSTSPGYYFSPSGVHAPPNPYTVQPVPAASAAYAVPPSNNNHTVPPLDCPLAPLDCPLAPLDCPLQVVAAPPSSWYATPTRPFLTYPISHERPAASAMPAAQASPAASLPLMVTFPTGAAAPPAPDPPSFAVPMSIAPTVSSTTLPPTALPWVPAHVSGLYEQQPLRTPAAPQYHIVTGGRSVSAPAPTTAAVEGAVVLHQPSASAPGMLWSVPRASGSGQRNGTNGLGSGLQQHHHNLVLEENLGSAASANELAMLSGGGSSRRPSLQRSVTDWQALIDGADDLAPTQEPSQEQHPPTSAATVGGGGGAGGSSGADVEAALASMMMP